MASQWLRRPVRGAQWLAVAIIGTLVAIGVANVVGFISRTLNPTPAPLSVQLENIIRKASESGFELTYSRVLDLKGVESDSRVMVFAKVEGSVAANGAGSDQFRIYDDDGGRLRLRLSFQPTSEERYAYTDKRGHHRILIKWPYRISVIGVRPPAAGAGGNEIYLGCIQEFADISPVRPLVVHWDPRQDDYELGSIMSRRSDLVSRSPYTTHLVKRFHRKSFAASIRKLYTTPVRLHDYSNPGTGVQSLAAESAQLTTDGVLLTTFRVSGAANASLSWLQVIGWGLEWYPGRVEAQECEVLKGNKHVPLLVRPRGSETYEDAARRAWRERPGKSFC